MALAETILAEGAAAGTSKLFKAAAGWFSKQRGFLSCSLYNRDQDARYVFSAIGCMKTEDGRYVLVRNLHRPESLAPFGGVYKYLAGSDLHLSSLEFVPHFLGKRDDADRDLRGFVKRKNLAKLHRWVTSGIGLETGNDCIQRELVEELGEISTKLKVPPLRLLRVRTVKEGPRFLRNVGYTQFRVFDVYLVDTGHAASRKFVRDLARRAAATSGLELVTPEEIRQGRSGKGTLISHTANYFFEKRSNGNEAPPFPRQMQYAGS